MSVLCKGAMSKEMDLVQLKNCIAINKYLFATLKLRDYLLPTLKLREADNSRSSRYSRLEMGIPRSKWELNPFISVVFGDLAEPLSEVFWGGNGERGNSEYGKC